MKCLLVWWFLWAFIPVGLAFGEERDPFDDKRPLKVLHITYHIGCADEVDAMGKELSIDITTWNLLQSPKGSIDGKTTNNAIYSIGHERAENIWKLHRDYFESFDVIMTSDTAPLSRIFLQNGWKKPLIIWICNRFDYYDAADRDCNFPDQEYYDLMRNAAKAPNVFVIGYTAYEHVYAAGRGVNTGGFIITPSGVSTQERRPTAFPANLNKPETFFIFPYPNETDFIDLPRKCTELGIPNYCSRYNGALDLGGFKGSVRLPGAWSNLAIFECMALGVPYFIPSKAFLNQLGRSGPYYPYPVDQFGNEFTTYSEWYLPEHASVITFFDSWEDLKAKVETADFPALSEASRNHAAEIKRTMLGRWKDVFTQCKQILEQQNH